MESRDAMMQNLISAIPKTNPVPGANDNLLQLRGNIMGGMSSPGQNIASILPAVAQVGGGGFPQHMMLPQRPNTAAPTGSGNFFFGYGGGNPTGNTGHSRGTGQQPPSGGPMNTVQPVPGSPAPVDPQTFTNQVSQLVSKLFGANIGTDIFSSIFGGMTPDAFNQQLQLLYSPMLNGRNVLGMMNQLGLNKPQQYQNKVVTPTNPNQVVAY